MVLKNGLDFLQEELIHLKVLKDSDRLNLLNWYQKNKLQVPWRKFWDKYHNPYHVWVSEIMLQQTLIKVVVPIYLNFIKKFPDIITFSRASEAQIRPYVKGLGYYRRFAYLHKGARELTSSLETKWPKSYEQWLLVSGVGPYTAAAISSIVLNEQRAVLDGNVERVFSRVFNVHLSIDTKGLKKIYQSLADKYLISDHPGDYNQAIMELGQRVCVKSKPKCLLCPVQSSCLAFKLKTQDMIPIAKQREKQEEVNLNFFLISYKSDYLLVSRSKKSKFLKEKIGFYSPEIEKNLVLTTLDKSKKKNLGSFTHSITHHKIKANVFLIKLQKKINDDNLLYVKKNLLSQKLISSLDQKALDLLI